MLLRNILMKTTPNMSVKVTVITLGCDKNRIDAEIMAKRLLDAGYLLGDDPYTSQAVVINTCGFIGDAKREALDRIFEMAAIRDRTDSELKKIVVTGCLAERYKEQAAELIYEADAVVGLAANRDIAGVLKRVLKGERPVMFSDPDELDIEGQRVISTPGHYAYLKIAEGCSNCCSYCVIPTIRG